MATHTDKITRIGIDGGEFNPQETVKSGIQRLLTGFLYGLSEIHPQRKRFIYYGFNLKKPGPDRFGITYQNMPEKFFSSVFLPLRLALDRIHVYLGFSGVIPPLTRLLRKKSIVFIHDFAFLDHPENYGDPGRMRWETEYALYGSDRIVVFSDYIREQVLRRFPKIPEKKVVRIYPGVDHMPYAKEGIKSKEPYFLYVGVIKPAKNILVLMSRFEKYVRLHGHKDVKLILIGTQEQAYIKNLQDTLLYHKLKNQIVFLKNVDDAMLSKYYRGSLGLLNVSHDEGFCYPVVEALEAGKKVIVNDIPLYNELKRYYPNIIITKSEDAFIKAMNTISKSECEKNPAGSPFKWASFTSGLLNVIDKIYQ